jgi:hypothetical protein
MRAQRRAEKFGAGSKAAVAELEENSEPCAASSARRLVVDLASPLHHIVERVPLYGARVRPNQGDPGKPALPDDTCGGLKGLKAGFYGYAR